ncbi:MAG: META domain-containing protein [Bacteroidales bacterium]|nr:META domain-containing protein [Bacteroidales bacterium]
MKATKLFLILIISFSIFNAACKRDEATICENLLEQGIADSTSIKGEWEFKYFAKTINGNKISKKEPISDQHWIGFNGSNINGGICNTLGGKYSLNSSNNISISVNSITFKLCDTETNELESTLIKSLNNAICFVVKGNELLIHYKEIDKRNVLVLTKK